MREYTLKELSRRADLRTMRAELLCETIDLAARGWPEDLVEIDRLDA